MAEPRFSRGMPSTHGDARNRVRVRLGHARERSSTLSLSKRAR
jgi:hypothetical protein